MIHVLRECLTTLVFICRDLLYIFPQWQLADLRFNLAACTWRPAIASTKQIENNFECNSEYTKSCWEAFWFTEAFFYSEKRVWVFLFLVHILFSCHNLFEHSRSCDQLHNLAANIFHHIVFAGCTMSGMYYSMIPRGKCMCIFSK